MLDDFQNIQDKVILEVLSGLLTQQLPEFHLIIVTREDPALPLAQFRSRNQLTEIRARDLRFSKDEISDFYLNAMQLEISEKDISILEERTEGWVTGLQLAGLSMKGREDLSAFVESLSGSHRYILGFLIEEVLNRQTPNVQSFLLQTSILSRLTGDLCDSVTVQVGSTALLENLIETNLFIIPLDDEQHWYRYHHLFADLLLSQLRRTHPNQENELHQRASRWYEAQNMPSDAIEHSLAAHDFARAVDLLETHIWYLLNNGYVRLVETWMQSIPMEWRDHNPRTSLGFAWMHLLRGNYEQVAYYLIQAETALSVVTKNSETTSMQAECFALRSNLMQAQGKIAESIEAAQSAMNQVEPGNSKVLGLAYLGMGSALRQAAEFNKAYDALQNAIRLSRESGDFVPGELALMHIVLMCIQHGRLFLAVDNATQIIEWMEHSENAPPPVVGIIYGALGSVYYEWNQFEKAREYFLQSIHLSTIFGFTASLIFTKICLSRLSQSEGDFVTASKVLTEAMDLLQVGGPEWLRSGLVNQQINLYLAENKFFEAEAVLRQSGFQIDDQIMHPSAEIYLAYLRLLLHRGGGGDLRQGIALADRILSLAESGQRNNTTIQTLILGSLCYASSGDEKLSLVWLGRALQLAEPEGYIRTFVNEGAQLAELLQRMPESAYARKLLTAFPDFKKESKTTPHRDGIVDPLTSREIEVLRLLATGLKYSEIAAQLVVSVNTVRFHVKGIYRKLNVDNQGKAIERARQLNLI